jgi:HD-like signal output (HDOD) protein
VPYELEQLVGGAQIPGLPQSAIRMLELSKDFNNGPPEYAQAIEVDPGLTGQILKFVNSSYFGFAKEITNVRHAITLLGVRTIKNFTLWSAVFSVMPNPHCGEFEVRHLWRDSLLRGLFARRLGKALDLPDVEEVFAAALLQDMALPLVVKEWPNEYAELLKRRADSGTRLSTLEKERFGWHHGDAGQLMCKKWGLPDSFVHLIGRHVEFDESEPLTDPRWVAVGISTLLPSVVDKKWEDRPRLVAAFQQFKGVVSIKRALADVDVDFNEFAPMLGIKRGDQTLTGWFESSSQTGCLT